METNIFATAVALSDKDLLARIDALATTEREATAELLGHLAALELRPSLYLAQGYGSLFEYCTQALHLSEDAACNRIKAVRACQQFPMILDLLFAGVLSLTAVRLLGPHLTPENHEAVLGRAAHKPRGDIEILVAELAPRPDVPGSVRKLPVPRAEASGAGALTGTPLFTDAALSPRPAQPSIPDDAGLPDGPSARPVATTPPDLQSTLRPTLRPVIQALAPERYRVQLTIGQETHDRLRRVQTLLRREIPSGDPAAIFDRALELLEEAAKSRLGLTARPRLTAKPAPKPDASGRAYETRIRFETDKPPSRHIPKAVKRAVWRRDRGTVRLRGRHRAQVQ